jgi:hypothetical protein
MRYYAGSGLVPHGPRRQFQQLGDLLGTHQREWIRTRLSSRVAHGIRDLLKRLSNRVMSLDRTNGITSSVVRLRW